MTWLPKYVPRLVQQMSQLADIMVDMFWGGVVVCSVQCVQCVHCGNVVVWSSSEGSYKKQREVEKKRTRSQKVTKI